MDNRILIPIKVTRKDIKEGLQGDGVFCPVGRAIQRKILKRYFPRVTSMEIRIQNELTSSPKTMAGVCPTPRRVAHWISNFDEKDSKEKEPVEPFQFNLRINRKLLRK